MSGFLVVFKESRFTGYIKIGSMGYSISYGSEYSFLDEKGESSHTMYYYRLRGSLCGYLILNGMMGTLYTSNWVMG